MIKFRTVTREEFFAAIGSRDIHPRSEPDRSLWTDQRTHEVVGISTPGYLARGPKGYQLAVSASDKEELRP